MTRTLIVDDMVERMRFWVQDEDLWWGCSSTRRRLAVSSRSQITEQTHFKINHWILIASQPRCSVAVL